MPPRTMMFRWPALLCLALVACGGEMRRVSSGGDAAPKDASLLGHLDAGADSGPACSLSCAELAAAYDASTQVIRFDVAPGANAVVSGAITFQVSGAGGGGIDTHSTTLAVNGRTLSADLSQWIPAGAIWLGGLSLVLVLDCGATANIGNLVSDAAREGGALILRNFRCG